MKKDYVLCIYNADNRTQSGFRLVSTTKWHRDQEGMEREVQELRPMWPASLGYHFEYQ
jgi:hypothetical protein